MTAPAAVGAQPVGLRSTLGWAFFGVWVVAVVVAGFVAPGEMFELALLGAVGLIVWAELRELPWTRFQMAAGLLCVAAPLLGTWPARKWQAAAGRVPAPLDGLVNLHSLLLLVALVLGGRRLWRGRPPRLLAGAGLLLIVGAVAGAIANSSASALADAWVAVVVPAGVGLVVARAASDLKRAWCYLGLVVSAVLPSLAVGTFAYALSFGIPTSGADLVFGKVSLFRPFLFQDLTFGNVGHFGDIAILLLPAATIAVSVPALSVRLRAAAAASAAGMLLLLFLVLSRSALAIAAVELIGTLALFVWRRRLRPVTAAAPALALAALVIVVSSPAVRTSFSSLLPASGLISGHGTPIPGSAGRGPGLPEGSERVRASALHTGLEVTRAHFPFGVGSGRYPTYDPVNTAPHSLFVQVAAEDGLLGAAGFVLLFVYVLQEGLRLVLQWRRVAQASMLLRLACIAGVTGFLLEGTVSGAPLALGQLNVWPLLLAVQLGLLAASRGWER